MGLKIIITSTEIIGFGAKVKEKIQEGQWILKDLQPRIY